MCKWETFINLITQAENFHNNKSRCFGTYASAFFSANDENQTELWYKRVGVETNTGSDLIKQNRSKFCLIKSLPVLVSTPPLLFYTTVLSVFCHLHWRRHLHIIKVFGWCHQFYKHQEWILLATQDYLQMRNQTYLLVLITNQTVKWHDIMSEWDRYSV